MRLVFKGVFRVASRQYTLIFFVPVRGESFAASDSVSERSRPAKPAFRRMKRRWDASHPAKTTIYRTGGQWDQLIKFTLAANVPQKCVKWHFPAKVELKKSHFGKPPLTECALRYPPCQSELAELQWATYLEGTRPALVRTSHQPAPVRTSHPPHL